MKPSMHNMKILLDSHILKNPPVLPGTNLYSTLFGCGYNYVI